MKQWSRFSGFENEQVLIAGLRRADSLAVEFWYKQYFSRLYQYARSKVATEVVAQEIVQDTFINCLQSLNIFQENSSLLTWMFSILRHEIADFYRKRYAKKFIQTIPLSEFLLEKDYVDAEETAAKVKAVLRQMLDDNKELLLKKYVDKKAVKEIAVEKGRSEKAIESELFRARKTFRKLWQELEKKEQKRILSC